MHRVAAVAPENMPRGQVEREVPPLTADERALPLTYTLRSWPTASGRSRLERRRRGELHASLRRWCDRHTNAAVARGTPCFVGLLASHDPADQQSGQRKHRGACASGDSTAEAKGLRWASPGPGSENASTRRTEEQARPHSPECSATQVGALLQAVLSPQHEHPLCSLQQ